MSDAARTALVAAMRRLAEGDRAALEDIYRATSAKLYGICYRILGDAKEAEDALQDVYVNLWQRASRYDPDRASPITWLAVFARNRAVDRLRAGAARRAARAPIEDAADLAHDAPSPDTLLERDERSARVYHCLETLAADQRENVREAFLGGRTYAELAMRRGVPLGTMKSAMRRSLARLRTCMEQGE